MSDFTLRNAGLVNRPFSFLRRIFEGDNPISSGLAAPLDVAMVEAELARPALFRLSFATPIEDRYEADTKVARAWNIRLAVPFGLVAYIAFSLFIDPALIPDLGHIPILSLVLVTPAGLFTMWMCSRASAAFRETFMSLAITATILLPISLVALSQAELAAYKMLVVPLISMFGNIILRLRFPWSCFFSAVTVAAVAGLAWIRSDLPAAVSITLVVAVVTCVAFGVIANNQFERAQRRSFLLTLREMLRAEQLSADNQALSVLSLSDPLTGLANRRAFDAELVRLWHAWRSQGQTFCLMMIDVDYFKRFNDRYGHPEGDICLARVGHALQNLIVRQNDMVARYGGEEFAVLVSTCNGEDALKIAKRLCHEVVKAAIPHSDRDDALGLVTISAGVACCQDMAPDAGCADLLLAADRGLYAAKGAGRNRAVAAASLGAV